jgi:hypothetical protein
MGGAILIVCTLLLNIGLFDPFVGVYQRVGVDETVRLASAWMPVFSVGPLVGLLAFAVGEAVATFGGRRVGT